MIPFSRGCYEKMQPLGAQINKVKKTDYSEVLMFYVLMFYVLIFYVLMFLYSLI